MENFSGNSCVYGQAKKLMQMQSALKSRIRLILFEMRIWKNFWPMTCLVIVFNLQPLLPDEFVRTSLEKCKNFKESFVENTKLQKINSFFTRSRPMLLSLLQKFWQKRIGAEILRPTFSVFEKK